MIIILPPGFFGFVLWCFRVFQTMKFSHMLWQELNQQDLRELQAEGQLQNRPCNQSPSDPLDHLPPSKTNDVVQKLM